MQKFHKSLSNELVAKLFRLPSMVRALGQIAASATRSKPKTGTISPRDYADFHPSHLSKSELDWSYHNAQALAEFSRRRMNF